MERFPCSLNRYVIAAVCGLLLLAVVLAFGQTERHSFINYDDGDYVDDNPLVARGFTVHGVAWAFTQFHFGNWHPLTWLSHMLDCQFYGLDHPGGHHLTNVFLHAANAILLFLVLRQMTGGLWPSAFAAALFAIHPLHVESVAWVAERKDVLSGLFFMLTLAAYIAYARRPFSLPRYLLVTALFALGLMAKPMLVTLPCVLLLLDYWPLGRLGAGSREQGVRAGWHVPELAKGVVDPKTTPSGTMYSWSAQGRATLLLLEKTPLFLLAAISCAVTYAAQSSALSPFESLPWSSRIANALVSYVAYLRQFYYPAGLAVFYPYPQDGIPIAKVAGCGLLLIGVSLAVLAGRRTYPYLFLGWFWYLGMLVPVIGLVQVGNQARADRYTYLSQIGLCVALAWGAEHVSRHWPYRRCVTGVASALTVTCLACCAWQQVSYWKDGETLWRQTVACTSKNYLAQTNLGSALLKRGEFNEAVERCQEALEIAPNSVEAHACLGAALAELGQYDDAITHFQAALKILPDSAEAHNGLGAVLARCGKFDDAVVQYQMALRIKPDFAAADNNLGTALAHLGQIDEAIVYFQKAVEIKPNFAEAYGNLGDALAARGQIGEAIVYFQKALELKPDLSAVHGSLGAALLGLGRVDEAIVHFQKALETAPNSAVLHVNLATGLASRRQFAAAIGHFQKALEIKPDFVEALDNLATAYAVAGRPEEAVETASKALDLATQQAKPALAQSIRAKIRQYEAMKADQKK